MNKLFVIPILILSVLHNPKVSSAQSVKFIDGFSVEVHKDMTKINSIEVEVKLITKEQRYIFGGVAQELENTVVKNMREHNELIEKNESGCSAFLDISIIEKPIPSSYNHKFTDYGLRLFTVNVPKSNCKSNSRKGQSVFFMIREKPKLRREFRKVMDDVITLVDGFIMTLKKHSGGA